MIRIRTYCDYCGRIAGKLAPIVGWYVAIPDTPTEPWLAACSVECADQLGYDVKKLVE